MIPLPATVMSGSLALAASCAWVLRRFCIGPQSSHRLQAALSNLRIDRGPPSLKRLGAQPLAGAESVRLHSVRQFAYCSGPDIARGGRRRLLIRDLALRRLVSLAEVVLQRATSNRIRPGVMKNHRPPCEVRPHFDARLGACQIEVRLQRRAPQLNRWDRFEQATLIGSLMRLRVSLSTSLLPLRLTGVSGRTAFLTTNRSSTNGDRRVAMTSGRLRSSGTRERAECWGLSRIRSGTSIT